jgi:hypothetical protein
LLPRLCLPADLQQGAEDLSDRLRLVADRQVEVEVYPGDVPVLAFDAQRGTTSVINGIS